MKRINFDKKTMLTFAGLLFVVLGITIGVYCFVKGKSPQEIIPTVKKENQELELVKKHKDEFQKLTQLIVEANFHQKVNEMELRKTFVGRVSKFGDKIEKIENMNIFKNHMKFLENEIKTCDKELKAFENKKEEDEDFYKKTTLESNKKDLEDEYKVCKEKEKLFYKKDNDATKQAEIDKELKIFIATFSVKGEIYKLNKAIENEKDDNFKQLLIKQRDLFAEMIK